MIIRKKDFIKLFKNYTFSIYRELGRNLSAKQRASIIYQVNKIYEQNTIRGKIKAIFKKIKENKEK